MALKNKFTLILLLFVFNLLASSSLDLFFTDKYDTNFFSSNEISNTELHIGCDLFRFVENKDMAILGSYIDSFLRTENVSFDQNVSFNNDNTLQIQLYNINAENSSRLSELWFEKYNITWIKLVKDHINAKNIVENDSETMILQKLSADEQLRPFHVSNIINNTLLAFIIPKSQTKNDFKRSQIYLNTKRYTSNESDFNYTEIISNENLAQNELVFNFPSYNKHSFLKNSISMHIIKRLLPNNENLEIVYSIAQSFVKYSFKSNITHINDLSLRLDGITLSKDNFKSYMNEAIDEIQTEINRDNLFFYSYYDKLKLEQLRFIYLQNDFSRQLESLKNKDKFIIELSPDNKLYFDSIKLNEVHHSSFSEGISFKPNSIKFANESDTLLLEKLNLFLALNKNYDLSIISSSKKSEYLFINKSKKDAIIDKYNTSDYTISYSKKLKLYRSLIVFNKLSNLNTDAKRLNCIGIRKKYSKVNFEFIMTN